MSDYIVRWEIDAEGAATARAAADYVDGLRRDPDAIVGVYTVIEKNTGAATDIDLDFSPEDAHAVCRRGTVELGHTAPSGEVSIRSGPRSSTTRPRRGHTT